MAEAIRDDRVACGSQPVPPRWPHLPSSQEVLAPLLRCASPAEFVALQRVLDMPRLVESLSDWDAVRLGTLGPLGADAAAVLNRKRATFLVTVTEKYGVPLAEVFALFILHTTFDDELRVVLQRLTTDKRLGETLGSMPSVREELKRRGIELSDYPDRAEQPGDALRGLARASRDALASTEVSAGARYVELSTRREQLPPSYQQALDEVERALMEQHFSPGGVALGSIDHLTFGVPLGFFHLIAATGNGTSALSQRKYEVATRELAPAALLLALYAGGKGARSLSEATGAGRGKAWRHQLPTIDATGLKAVVARLEERLGASAASELLQYLRASREGALVAAEWGEAGMVALYEARGNAAKAQVLLAEASRERAGPTPSAPGTKPAVSETSRGGAPSTDTPIRNAHLAGGKHPVTGVPFDAEGYPDFRAAGVVKAEVKVNYTGSRAGDFAAANKAAGLRETPKGMTWHHHQDRVTMQLVPTDIHARTGHTGGFGRGP
ncbi:HNH endonuclease [Myxococcaceae bacterium GXIMD 01537]